MGAVAMIEDRRPRSQWPPERVATLRELFDTGMSFELMARQMGVTKGVVSAKVARLGWERDETTAKVRRRMKPRPVLRLVTDAPLSRMVPLLDLTPADCRWPTGTAQDGEHRFCGAKAEAGAYCAYHARRACQPGSYEEIG